LADSLKITDAILEANFPDVPLDRRQQYAALSRGFVRLAADMCQRDMELAGGEIFQFLGSVERYVKRRLRNEHLPLVALLSLFHKVGFKDEVRADLEVLCKIANCSPKDFRDAVKVVRESPGFVVQAGRYWYVTPEIVAHLLFVEGWQQWVSGDPVAFLQALPDHLQRHLIDRVGRLGGEEVRADLATYFRQWFNELRVGSLSDARVTSLACAVVEAMPEEYLPKLRYMLENARNEEISRITGQTPGDWGPRRYLVWLLERLVSFPEFFEGCEACLFRLALQETEPQIGNSATAIWRNLFGVELSGTATHFQVRSEVLRRRTHSRDLREAALAFEGLAIALDEVLYGHAIGPPVIAGRLRPADWSPTSNAEARVCYQSGLALCGEHIEKGDPDYRSLALKVLIDHLPNVLLRGLLTDVAMILSPDKLTEYESRKLLNTVDDFMAYEEEAGRASTNAQATQYMQQVKRWIDAFRPTDFDRRLRAVCAREPWDPRFDTVSNDHRDEMSELAKWFLTDPSRLSSHLDWLASREARSAQRLGFALGSTDRENSFGTAIFRHALSTGAASLLRGYVQGLASSRQYPNPELFELMAQVEASHPEMAVDVLCFAGDGFDALNHAIRLVESRVISPRLLATFAMGIGGRELQAEEFARLLPYFANASRSGDTASGLAGIRFLAAYLKSENRRSDSSVLQLQTVCTAAWDLVESSLPFIGSQLSYEWSQITQLLAGHDPSRGTRLLGEALLSENLNLQKKAEHVLIALAPAYPDAVMEGFGAALLDPDRGWRLQVCIVRDLVHAISPPSVMVWLRSQGIEAARAIARHLPRPFLTDVGEPVIPELLDTILRDFDDDQAFSNFLAGVHSGESWWGDGSEQFRREAEEASHFLHHPNHRIREWAKHEIDDRRAMAEAEQRDYAERLLPS
jgi:hypothetical protein